MSILKFAKTFMLAGVAVAGLTACNDLEGILKANENLTLINKDKKTVTLPAGSYKTELDVDSKKVKVKIEVNDKTQKFEFAVPEDALKDDTFNVPAEQTGQAYGLQGTRTVEESSSGVRQDWEQCQYDEWYTRCATDSRGRTQCWQERVTRWGRRFVQYEDIYTTYTVAANLVSASGSAAAQFNGDLTVTERQYYQSDYCR
ncbi:MAG: hypothetical protein AABZ31_10980 [Bdellovibrionota bacterium]